MLGGRQVPETAEGSEDEMVLGFSPVSLSFWTGYSCSFKSCANASQSFSHHGWVNLRFPQRQMVEFCWFGLANWPLLSLSRMLFSGCCGQTKIKMQARALWGPAYQGWRQEIILSLSGRGVIARPATYAHIHISHTQMSWTLLVDLSVDRVFIQGNSRAMAVASLSMGKPSVIPNSDPALPFHSAMSLWEYVNDTVLLRGASNCIIARAPHVWNVFFFK